MLDNMKHVFASYIVIQQHNYQWMQCSPKPACRLYILSRIAYLTNFNSIQRRIYGAYNCRRIRAYFAHIRNAISPDAPVRAHLCAEYLITAHVDRAKRGKEKRLRSPNIMHHYITLHIRELKVWRHNQFVVLQNVFGVYTTGWTSNKSFWNTEQQQQRYITQPSTPHSRKLADPLNTFIYFTCIWQKQMATQSCAYCT